MASGLDRRWWTTVSTQVPVATIAFCFGVDRLPLGPLVPIEPDLHRVRAIGTYVDERNSRSPAAGTPRKKTTPSRPVAFGPRCAPARTPEQPDRGHLRARPVSACRAGYGRIISILRSFLPNRTTGIRSAANDATAGGNAVPIFALALAHAVQ